jgi:hypothetical protein
MLLVISLTLVIGNRTSEIPVNQYLSAAVSVHAILLSLAALLSVNSLKQLTQIAEKRWERSKGKDIPRNLRWLGELQETVRRIKNSGLGIESHGYVTSVGDEGITNLMRANLVTGSIGILYSLFALAFNSAFSSAFSSTTSNLTVVLVSLVWLGLQLYLFFALAEICMKNLGKWYKDVPEEKPEERSNPEGVG